jgi:hypothetical protein
VELGRLDDVRVEQAQQEKRLGLAVGGIEQLLDSLFADRYRLLLPR